MRTAKAYAPVQSDQGLQCPLTEILDTSKCMNGEQMLEWYFAHTQVDLNLHIFGMFQGTFSFDVGHDLKNMTIIK